jgi:hypothetical protein
MKTIISWLTVLSAFCGFGLALPNEARADETVIVTSSPAPARSDYERGPDRTLLYSGVMTLGLTYGVSAVVAFVSDRFSDRNLYIPVAGPWMDLADRGSCHGCAGETTDKFMLVVDGILQGLGALEVVGGLLMGPERSATNTAAAVKPAAFTLRAAPMLGRNSFGVRALASF